MVDAMSDAYRQVLSPSSCAHHAHRPSQAEATSSPTVVYVTSRFPSTPMTFVTNEMLGVRAAGASVSVAAVWPPDPSTIVHRADLEFVSRRVDLSLRNCSVWWAAWRQGVAAAQVRRAVGELIPGHAKSPVLLLKLAACIPKGLALARWSTLHGVSWFHAHFLSTPTTVALIASAATGTPYSCTGHAFDLYDRSKGVNGSVDVKCRRAAFVVQISDYNARFQSSSMPEGDGSRFVRINNGIDPSVFEPLDSGTPRDSADPLRVVSVGTLVSKKGHDTLIRAVSRVARERPVTLTIVGEGPEGRGLVALISELGCGSFVTIRPAMEQSDVLSVLREADVFALACRTTKSGDVDGLPTVILEAMACALPVVSTEVSGIPEAVEHGVTGLLTASDDVESLAESLAYLAEHPDVGRVFGQRGRERVLADFNLWRSGQLLTELWAEYGAASSPGPELGGRRSPSVEDAR
jgi:colanic acid/amylovoran biosynthesis glycosyltransferase